MGSAPGGGRAPCLTWGGGRWSAFYSLWTYVHRLLHIIGITALDTEELALLSAPLVHIRTASNPPLILTHAPAPPTAPADPLQLLPPSATTPASTLFVLHFETPGDNDAARLATAHPTPTAPRAWVAVDPRSGALSLTAAEPNAAVFELRTPRRPRRPAAVTLAAPCAAGVLLAPCGGTCRGARRRDSDVGGDDPLDPDNGGRAVPGSRAVRVCASEGDGGAGVQFMVNAVAMTPAADGGAQGDAALAEVLRRAVVLPVRLQSVAHGWFMASSPGADLAAARRGEPGWDAFTVEFDYATRTARIRDSRGMYIVLAPGLRSFRAGITVDGLQAQDRAGTPGKAVAVSLRSGGGGSSASAADTGHQNGMQRRSRLPPSSPMSSGASTASSESSTAAAAFKSTAGLYGGLHSDDDDSAGECEGELAGDLLRAERFRIEIAGDDDRVTLRSRKGYLSARRNGTVCVNQNTQPGRTEQFFLRIALPSMMDQSSASLRLRHHAHGVREVEAGIVVPASADVVYGVLRDYDGFKRFIKDCSTSELVGHNAEDGSLVVRMAQAHSFLMLTISMSMTLRVCEFDEEHRVTMDLVHGMGVKTYKGAWTASRRSDGRCGLRVKISSSPSLPAPNFLVDGVMTHAVTSTLDQIRTEAILRSTGVEVDAPAAACN